MGDEVGVERIVRAVVSLFFRVCMVLAVLFFAHRGEWDWAWLLLGIFAVGYLVDIRDSIKDLQ